MQVVSATGDWLGFSAIILLAAGCMTSGDVISGKPWKLVSIGGQAPAAEAGLGVALSGTTPWDGDAAYRRVQVDDTPVTTVDPAHFVRRRDGLAWVEALVRRSAERPARWGCFGLHEWAMVYGLDQQQVRHESWPLRLSPDEIRDVVDEQGLHCTHFDAFRFFTPESVPLNELAPTRATQPDLEQPVPRDEHLVVRRTRDDLPHVPAGRRRQLPGRAPRRARGRGRPQAPRRATSSSPAGSAQP